MQARLVVLDPHQERVAGRGRGGEGFLAVQGVGREQDAVQPSCWISAWAAAISSPSAIS